MQEILKAITEVHLFDLIMHTNNSIKLCLLVQTLALLALIAYTLKSIIVQELHENLMLFGLFGAVLGTLVLVLSLHTLQTSLQAAHTYKVHLEPKTIAENFVPFAYGLIILGLSSLPQLFIKPESDTYIM